ncbi:hypothetical protein KPH14_007692 [Odynerus spinipes]|uniref:Uncharacterized protein n=1 Tax=Odynerus spinipes TaxID=1348599 RepID=A0AAD9RJU5_9HYME|nr:hypothetical protein KPH14_007692 [Odynerus spinipes]
MSAFKEEDKVHRKPEVDHPQTAGRELCTRTAEAIARTAFRKTQCATFCRGSPPVIGRDISHEAARIEVKSAILNLEENVILHTYCIIYSRATIDNSLLNIYRRDLFRIRNISTVVIRIKCRTLTCSIIVREKKIT